MESLGARPSLTEKRLELVHRVIVPDEDYPREYAVLVTDRRSIFIRQKRTRNSWVLRQEMRFGTGLVTDVMPKTLQDYSQSSLETMVADRENLTVPHDSITKVIVRADQFDQRRRDFFVRMVMKRQREVFQVYNFEMNYDNDLNGDEQIRFYAVPLGAYFKPRRQFQTRETILRQYADGVLKIYEKVLPPELIHQLPGSELKGVDVKA